MRRTSPSCCGSKAARRPVCNGNRGAVTWGDETVGITGTPDASNSLVGTHANDYVGFGGVMALRNGNYVISSPAEMAIAGP